MEQNLRYPIYFLNKQGKEVARISKYTSIDGTPRYNVNPKSPENTYTLQDCLKDWQPVYKFYVGDKVQWFHEASNNIYDCIVRVVKRRDDLVRIKADKYGENPLPYIYYWVEPSELNLKQ